MTFSDPFSGLNICRQLQKFQTLANGKFAFFQYVGPMPYSAQLWLFHVKKLLVEGHIEMLNKLLFSYLCHPLKSVNLGLYLMWEGFC